MAAIGVYNLKYNTTCGKCNTEYSSSDYFVRDKISICLSCAGLADLTFLEPGDAALTRRSQKYSSRCAFVYRYSTARKRYERVGILVEEDAINKAKEESAQDTAKREKNRKRGAERRAKQNRKFLDDFAKRIRELYPSMPDDLETENASYACSKNSGRVGRSAGARSLEEPYINLAVEAHVRHRYTGYNELLQEGYPKELARAEIREDIDELVCQWSKNPTD